MKSIKKIFLSVTAICTLFAAFLLSSCYEPSPLYGKWADDYGNYVTFTSDGTFVAKIYIEPQDEKSETNYQGEYSVIDNVLVFTVSEKDGETVSETVNTEWDIRGSMLYLTWTNASNSKTLNLTLYHVSK